MKGTINENIIDMLNLRPLDEVLKEKGVDIAPPEPPVPEPRVADTATQQTVSKLQELSSKLVMVEGTDHSEAMDNLHDEMLQHARDLMTYGFNIDHPRARGIFEVATLLYGHAITAKTSKRDAQLKSMKLAIDRKKVELEEKRTNHVIGANPRTIDEDDTVLVEDRNELLRRIRQQSVKP